MVQESSDRVTMFPSNVFEKILQDRNHSSYLGKTLKRRAGNVSNLY